MKMYRSILAAHLPDRGRIRFNLLLLITALTIAACATPELVIVEPQPEPKPDYEALQAEQAARAEQERLAAEQAAAQAAQARREATLAILPFTGVQDNEGETIAELFSFQKEVTAAFSPMPRTGITRAIQNEQGFQMTSGMTNPETIAALGKQLGAKYVVAGTITKLGDKNLLIIAILHTEDLRQIAGDIQTYTTLEEIKSKLPAMAHNIAAALKIDASNLPLLAIPPVQWTGEADNQEADTLTADTLSQILAVHLIESGRYAVYPRTKSLEQVQQEYNYQFGGDTADEYLADIGKGTNPRLVLSVTTRRLGGSQMFNAAVINLETGIQEAGDTVNYQDIDDGMSAMEELALRLTGQEEALLKREQEAEEAAANKLLAGTQAEFAQAIAAINGDKTNGTYTITVNGSFSSAPLSFTGNAGKTIILKGDGIRIHTITNNGGGSLFTVPEGITLVLEGGITLNGNGKEASLVFVEGGTVLMNSGSTVRNAQDSGVVVNGGTFTMEGGAISDNTTYYSGYGGGVLVWDGTFTMKGGSINGNTASSGSGGGVFVSGTFTMKGGSIQDNTTSVGGGVFVADSGTFRMAGGNISDNTASDGGGGVFVNLGTFTMEGGTISTNTSSSSDYPSSGGGVVVWGTFTMKGGTISTNTASLGGGVYVDEGGTFTMTDGTISTNTSYSTGGGVYVHGTFTMIGGSISTNTSDYGGGVLVNDKGTFTMEGGSISGNTASSSGGGVFVNLGTFTMTDGSISTNTTSLGGGVVVNDKGTFTMKGGSINGNTASSGSGGGVVVDGTFTMERGSISGNTASGSGGGVVVGGNGTFTKRGGGTIDATNTAPKGKVVYVYINGNSGKERTSAAGSIVDLDSRRSGSAGGWE